MSGPRPNPKRLAHPALVPAYGRKISALRMQRGWPPAELARRIGVHWNSVRGWESGKNEPSITKFAAIARIFGVSLDDLYGEGAS